MKHLFSLLALIGIIALSACGIKENRRIAEVDPAFSAYISGYTSGYVSSETFIRIRLSNPPAHPIQLNMPIKKNLFSFSPSIKGTAYWIDEYTIEFRPENRLTQGQFYNATFKLKDIMNVPAEFSEFKFQFSVFEQNVEIQQEGFKPYENKDLTRQKFHGTLLTADVADEKDVVNSFTAKQEGKNLNISWEHLPDRKTHRFTVEEVARKDEASELHLEWDARPLGSKTKGEEKIRIPALSEFSLMSSRLVHEPEQYVILQFSDPLKENQRLEGLVHLRNQPDPRFIIRDNEIWVYPPSRLQGTQTLVIEKGVENILGYKFSERTEVVLSFESLKPLVRLIGNGVIIPNSNALVFPFEAVNLRRVDVTIIRVFENNISQFLQVNSLDGHYELNRVGKPIARRTISLQGQGVNDLGRWNRFSIDLAEFIRPEPGALYQVKIGFRKSHSIYFCAGAEAEDADEPLADLNWGPSESSHWDYYQGYYMEGYEWSQRDNPCHVSYYGERRSVSRNILASDIGIMAKKGNGEEMLFTLTEITTTNPMSGVQLEVYDYQRQLLASGTSDGQTVLFPLWLKTPLLF